MILVVAANDLQRRLRNRSLVLQAFVGPLLLATIISQAVGGGLSFDTEVTVATSDGSQVARAIQETLVEQSGEGVTFVAAEAGAELEGPAVVLPAGLEASMGGGEAQEIRVVTSRDEAVGTEVARGVARALAARFDTARLAIAAAEQAGVAPPPASELLSLDPPVGVAQLGTGPELSPAAHFGPGMGLLFLFLSVGLVARSLLQERRVGILDRIHAAPVNTSAVLAGKCLSVVIIGVLSLLVIWAATSLLLGAAWGEPAGVVALIVVSALAVAGVAGLVATLARTEQGADSAASMVAFTLSLIGGNMLPPADLPGLLQRLSLLTPNGWSMQGFAELSAGEGSFSDVVPHLAVLAGWAAVMLAISARRLPRKLGLR